MKMIFYVLLILSLTEAMIFVSCNKDDITGSNVSEPKDEIADAGPDIKVYLPSDTAHLTATKSYASSGIAKYEWNKVYGPDSLVVVNPNAAETKVGKLSKGVYEIELTIWSNRGNIARDRVFVFVLDSLNDPCNGCWDY